MTRQPRESGVLIVEAVVASFLMIFAFVAASQLFDAAIRWESEGGNVRLASIIAERRMAELRRWSEDYFATHSFDDPGGWPVRATGIPTPDPETPTVDVSVIAEAPTYTLNTVSTPNFTTPAGFHSPASHFYFVPVVPGANAQRHEEWRTYPYSRDLSQSIRRVEVTVFYGGGTGREFRLVSLIGDPVKQGDNPTVVISGPGSIAPNATQTYTVSVNRGGAPVTDVTALWSLSGDSTGSATIKALDSSARSVEVTRSVLTGPGQGARIQLTVKIRYAGKESVGYSNFINMP